MIVFVCVWHIIDVFYIFYNPALYNNFTAGPNANTSLLFLHLFPSLLTAAVPSWH